MKKREIFSLLVSCHEVTYDDKDNMRRVYIDEEKSIKTLSDLKKAIAAQPSNVQKEFAEYQHKVETYVDAFKFKYPQLIAKANAMFDPKEFEQAMQGKSSPIMVTTGNTTQEPSETKEGD